MSLLNKVNFTKGWPNPSIQEEVLMPDTGVTIEAGFIGARKQTDPDVWILGIDALIEEVFIFRNDSTDPDAARAAATTDSKAIPFGGVQGISFQNPLEIETIQYTGSPAIGDQLFAHTDGKLGIAVTKAGLLVAASKVVIAVVTKPLYYVGQHGYIRVVPCQKYVSPSS
jgi:hypothetical protein